MKRSSIVAGAAIGVLAVILLAAVFKLFGSSPGEAVHARQAWHGDFRYGHPIFIETKNRSDAGSAAAWLIPLRAALLLGGAVLFFKAKGFVKWAGAAAAAVGTLSLLTPLWGSIVLIAVILIYIRVKNNDRKYNSPQGFSAFPSSIDASQSRGRFLDEWERNQHREE